MHQDYEINIISVEDDDDCFFWNIAPQEEKPEEDPAPEYHEDTGGTKSDVMWGDMTLNIGGKE